MDERQRRFLDRVARSIRQIFEALHDGGSKASMILGRRRVNGRVVELRLEGRVQDGQGTDSPMATHSTMPPDQVVRDPPPNMATPKRRRRSPRRRGR